MRSTTYIEPVTFRYMSEQLQLGEKLVRVRRIMVECTNPNVISNYTIGSDLGATPSQRLISHERYVCFHAEIWGTNTIIRQLLQDGEQRSNHDLGEVTQVDIEPGHK